MNQPYGYQQVIWYFVYSFDDYKDHTIYYIYIAFLGAFQTLIFVSLFHCFYIVTIY